LAFAAALARVEFASAFLLDFPYPQKHGEQGPRPLGADKTRQDFRENDQNLVWSKRTDDLNRANSDALESRFRRFAPDLPEHRASVIKSVTSI